MTSIKETFSEVIAELKDYIEAKKSLIELKATEKGAPIVAKSIIISHNLDSFCDYTFLVQFSHYKSTLIN